MGNAQSAIQEQFNTHKCKPESATQPAPTTAKATTPDR